MEIIIVLGFIVALFGIAALHETEFVMRIFKLKLNKEQLEIYGVVILTVGFLIVGSCGLYLSKDMTFLEVVSTM
jgi:hypothetical protein